MVDPSGAAAGSMLLSTAMSCGARSKTSRRRSHALVTVSGFSRIATRARGQKWTEQHSQQLALSARGWLKNCALRPGLRGHHCALHRRKATSERHFRNISSGARSPSRHFWLKSPSVPRRSKLSSVRRCLSTFRDRRGRRFRRSTKRSRTDLSLG
jgi:hypothetical protein